MLFRGALASGLGLALVVGSSGPGLAVVPMAIPVAPAGAIARAGDLGARPGATRLPINISDHVTASVDVGTGNLMISVTAVSLPGINGDVPLGLVYNSESTDTTGADVAARWTLSLGGAGSLSTTP